MGYETRIHVVSTYPFTLGENEPPMGEELAMIDLCKCGYDGPLEELMSKYRHKSKDGGKPTFAIYARNPERQQEAVEVLREFAELATSPPDGEEGFNFTGSIEARTEKANYLNKLSNHVEDGTITTDCYGDFLSAIPIDEFIEALEAELKRDDYRRFRWALVLLKSIKESWDFPERLRVITYGH